MKSIIIILVAILIFGGRMLYLYLKRSRVVELMPVEAGPTANAKEDFTQPVPVQVGDLDMDSELQYFIVRNECMKPLNINPNDIVGVQMFNDDFTIKDIENGDILLIYLSDDKFQGYKIRVLDHSYGDLCYTYYFNGNNKQNSSKPHSLDKIKGIVKEINHPIQ